MIIGVHEGWILLHGGCILLHRGRILLHGARIWRICEQLLYIGHGMGAQNPAPRPEEGNGSVPGGYKQPSQIATSYQRMTWQASQIATSYQGMTWQAGCKNKGLQGLHTTQLTCLQSYSSQPGGPQGAGGYEIYLEYMHTYII